MPLKKARHFYSFQLHMELTSRHAEHNELMENLRSNKATFDEVCEDRERIQSLLKDSEKDLGTVKQQVRQPHLDILGEDMYTFTKCIYSFIS